jgi:hypothetical protein
VRVTFLLCDSAQAVGGKLYLLGGAWNITPAGRPLTLGLAINVNIAWNETNQRHTIQAVLLDEDGGAVSNPEDGSPIAVDAQLEIGRPPGSKPGSSFNAPLAVNMNLPPLPEGGYRWDLLVDGTVMATESFQITAAPKGT